MNVDQTLLGVIKQGRLDEVIRLVEQEGANPAYQINEPIRLAVKFNWLEIVDYLLQNPQVDPAANKNEIIRVAIEEGQVEMVQRLVQDSRVNPMVDDNYPMYIAVLEDKVAIVDVLARVPGLLLGTVEYYLRHKNNGLLFKLARMTGLKPHGDNVDYIAWAASIGSLKLIRRLMGIIRISADDIQFLIACARHYGHTKIINYLEKLTPAPDPTIERQ